MTTATRPCPICECQAATRSFPYAIRFNNKVFHYLRCRSCGTVFVDSLPDYACFARIYNKADYHELHYNSPDLKLYHEAAELCLRFAEPGASVLDYGCGVGHFMQAAKHLGFSPHGVEFDASAAAAAEGMVGCPVYTVAIFDQIHCQSFDVIHLGDVLEHLPDPAATLAELLKRLKLGGLLFVEGPLEANPSPVYWAARLFGSFKYLCNPALIGPGVPYHLFFTSALAQSRFFRERFPALQPVFWRTLESGWPYAKGNWIKRVIANLALLVGGKTVAGIVFGNRFQAIYVLR